MTEIERIDKADKRVYFTDETYITPESFGGKMTEYFKNRIAGETIVWADMERFMKRLSAKNLSQMLKGKKMEGFLEGAAEKKLTRGQTIGLISIVVIIIVILVVVMIAKSTGVINI